MNKTVKERTTYPSYIALSESGELEERIHRAYALLASCTVCRGNVELTASRMNGAFVGQVSFPLYQVSDLILAKNLLLSGRRDPALSL